MKESISSFLLISGESTLFLSFSLFFFFFGGGGGSVMLLPKMKKKQKN